MSQKSLFIYVILIILLLFGGFQIYKFHTKPEQKPLFLTQNAIFKDISHSINATGYLEIKDNLQVGSLVAGTIERIYVQEREHVKKGQPLAILTLIKADTEVRSTQGDLIKAQATYKYKLKNFIRQKKLFNAGFIALDEFERLEQEVTIAKGDLYSKQALFDKAKIEYENRIIKAPAQGTIISIGVTEGQKTTTDLDATVLFNIAPDTTKMEAVLEIDEADISSLQAGLRTKIIADSLPSELFEGKIDNLNFSPCKSKEERKKNNCNCTYEARISIDNSAKLLRPGMSVSGIIKVKKLEKTLAINNQAFYINVIILKQIAKKLNFEYKELDKEAKKTLYKNKKPGNLKFIWIATSNAFIQTPVWTDINDDTHVAIISGITAEQAIITSIVAPNELDKEYKKWFKTF